LSLEDWIGRERVYFDERLTRYGGILFRGFGIDTVERFQGFMNCFDCAPLPYMFRSSPRDEIDKSVKNIYRSTTYPNNRKINMHNESSYSRIWGRKIVFCCIQPAVEGGETPIADSRHVLRDIGEELVNRFRTKGIKYVRNLSSEFGMSWQEVFQTSDKEKAAHICRRFDIQYRFVDSDRMTIEWRKPAVYNHPKSGEETWFNHAYFFHKFSRYEELGLSPDDIVPGEYLSSQTFFGDGSEIGYKDYLRIKEAYDKNTVTFPYEKGDVIFLDNMLAAHGRMPYKGDRAIATAIIEAEYDRVNI
jgi:alpha-ketoglutarate-dependent taurine dioxygenase